MAFTDYAELRRVASRALRTAQEATVRLQTDCREHFVKRVQVLQGDTWKRALGGDLYGELHFMAELKKSARERLGSIETLGEESLTREDLDLSDRHELVCIADIIDGTDLFERDLNNWCSAAVFFDPQAESGNRIAGAFVLLPESSALYLATPDRLGAWVEGQDGQERPVGGSRPGATIEDASIYFYGQKAKSLRSVSRTGLVDRLPTAARLYNLAGNPIMVRVVDHLAGGGAGADAVVEIAGQLAHDAVPGAFIALSAGATLLNPVTGEPVSAEFLENALYRPASSRVTYILAGNANLAHEILNLVNTRVA